jgi:predicted GTPase
MSLYSNYRLNDITIKLDRARFYPLDVMVSGVTGAGKSSTLNALFQRKLAQVGAGVEPETMEIDNYLMNERIRLWDTPGLGDGIVKDKIHSKKIITTLQKAYQHNDGLFGYVDLALIILDGSTREMGTTYRLLNEVLLPHISADRVMVVINQADVAMKGRHWCLKKNCPDPVLYEFLTEKALSIQQRILETSNLLISSPIFYSAEKQYNINGLFDFIIDHIPTQRRTLNLG